MSRIGFLINPIAGMGGRVGLKGTDGVADEAMRRGAEPVANARALDALRALKQLLDGMPDAPAIDWRTASGAMGEDALRAAGFTVDTRDVTDIMSVKLDAGVPGAMSSCHTAIVEGYVVEGHVPAEQVERLLAERPEIAGIAVPGMPVGSPGMEGNNPQPYQVLSIGRDGSAAVFAEVDPR